MSALVFPLVALTLVLLVITPLVTLVVWGALNLRRRSVRRWVDFGSDGHFLLLVAPVLFPWVWLISSAVHEFEPATALSSCLIEHLDTQQCSDALVLLSGVLIVTVAFMLRQLKAAWPGAGGRRLRSDHPAAQRVHALIARTPALQSVPIFTVEASPEPIFTLGLWSPRVELDARFVHDNDDAALHAALLHEIAHVRRRDPLRFVLGRLFLAINPAGRLLEADFARWRQAREAVCDLDAVLDGGSPLALAHAIVRAARFERRRAYHTAALCGDGRALRLRLTLLTGYANATPTSKRRALNQVALWSGVALAILIPHSSQLALLSSLHIEVEYLLISLGLI